MRRHNVVNLNSNPAERRHGTRTKEFTFMSTPHTRTNLTDSPCPVCKHYILDGDCLCTLAPEKPVIKNAKGEPYEVAWTSRKAANVFHPGKFVYAAVDVTHDATLTCKGYSDGERCWQFYNKAHCNHTLAVENSIKLGERPAPAKPSRLLEDIYPKEAA
jgi:hypothetical protein